MEKFLQATATSLWHLENDFLQKSDPLNDAEYLAQTQTQK